MKISPSINTVLTCLTIFSFNTGFAEGKARILEDEGTQQVLQTTDKRRALGRSAKNDPLDAIGVIYGSLIIGVSRNPSLKNELVELALLGHASALTGDDLDSLNVNVEKLKAKWALMEWEEE
ncbi:predicted protein [Chaetoceros tenuissimus]|uniref:Uncharacterized protein n=1 Tax=Chaetoceros tenuissimus TaxID=426638 RepID=A0AAD3H7G7_9STRA|nr:predicted protein [Chaetoceros tenuissimus]